MRDIAAYYGMSYRAGLKKATLHSRFSELRFVIDKRESLINTVTVHLSRAPVLWKREIVLSEGDFRLLLEPLLRPKAMPQRQVKRIMLDPGHGGTDRGASGKRYHEKDIVLQLCNKAARMLRAKGYIVGMTRRNDTTLKLSQRTALAKQWKADLFVSVHANSSASTSVKGIETFLVTRQGNTSTYGSKIRKHACPGNRFDIYNTRVAYEIQKALVKNTGGVDRGIKHAQFLVLRNAPCPAVLIETGFISNVAEETALGSATHQDKLVSGLVNGILAYQRAVSNEQ